MQSNLADIERRLVETASMIDRQRQLVVVMGERGFSTEAPLQLLSHMLRHLHALEIKRREVMRIAPGAAVDCRA
ncbi:MAG TPA: hypothetical protein VFB45_21870 [Pseudolabrys sp.]|nr:hypothetical protein [Pseudolabrys sp.]